MATATTPLFLYKQMLRACQRNIPSSSCSVKMQNNIRDAFGVRSSVSQEVLPQRMEEGRQVIATLDLLGQQKDFEDLFLNQD
mmetsp:Transcript_36303/g.56888  ORF Transcript_36303/g.56888 Transcript_36303/m.56888 type:complete len:82 (+) Transcript_36303:35-280(+)